MLQSHARYQALVEASSQIVWTADPGGAVIEDSPSWMAFTGQTTEQLRGFGFLDAIHPEDRTRVHEWAMRTVADGRPAEIEHRLRHVSGEWRWMHVRAVPVLNPDGSVREWVGMSTDVTTRRQADQKLRDSEQRFMHFMQHLPGLAWIKDSAGRYIYANEAAQQAFRRRWHELIGKTDHDVFTPETAAHFTANDRRVLDQATNILTIESLLHEDGVVHQSIVSKFPVPDADGQMLVGGVAIDVTELKRAEEALRESEERLRLSQQIAHVGTFDWNLQTGVNVWTSELEAMYGLAPGEFGRTQTAWEDLVHPDDRAAAVRSVQIALQSGQAMEAEWRIVWPDGTVRWIAGRFQAFKDSSGKPIRLTGVNLDITERTLAEAALRESDRRRNEFLAMLAHELRNPLAPILVSIEVLRRSGHGDDPRMEHAVDVLQRQVGQMVRLVDDLLDAARISRGKIELRRERVQLASILNHVLEAIRPLARSKGQGLTVVLPAQAAYLDADATRLAQIVGNLLNNACKFTGPGGQIWLTAEIEASSGTSPQVAIRVRDTGIGIAPDEIGRVFEMFAQADVSLERAASGLGIGLTLVKTLTEMHDGTVEASSAGPGKGSEFVVRLPVVIEQGMSAAVPSITAATGTDSLRILIVDDNRDAAEMLASLLRIEGHETHTAHDGVAALQATERLRPDLLLLDIGLPGLNGYEVARHIRERHDDATRPRLVALTGWGQDEDRRRSREAGFDAHLVKPVDGVTLSKVLTDVLARRLSPARRSPGRD